jgi:hypothetical protein
MLTRTYIQIFRNDVFELVAWLVLFTTRLHGPVSWISVTGEWHSEKITIAHHFEIIFYCVYLVLLYFIHFVHRLGSLIGYKGFWWWCIPLRIAVFLDFWHRPVFWKLENVKKLDLFPLSCCLFDIVNIIWVVQWLRLVLSKGPSRVCVGTETDPIFPDRRVF